MWKDLSIYWQAAFEEAWIAFGNGCTPIGAALADENGELLLRDHNRNGEPGTVNRRIAHAEANLLRRLDTAKYDPLKVTLYTTMEPCPMCMGTASVSHIKHLRAAAHDPHCGMIHLTETETYYIEKGLDYSFECGDNELVQLTMQSYYELGCMEHGSSSYMFDSFSRQCPKAAGIAKKLYSEKKLDLLVSEGQSMGDVYDLIVELGREQMQELSY